MDYYQAVGDCFVCGSSDGYDILCRTADEFVANISDPEMREIAKDQFNKTHRYYGSVMSAEDFIRDVRSGCIRGSDGILGKIFISKFTSNLGIIDLDHDFLCGGFPITLDFLEELCEDYIIEVEWSNK